MPAAFPRRIVRCAVMAAVMVPRQAGEADMAVFAVLLWLGLSFGFVAVLAVVLVLLKRRKY